MKFSELHDKLAQRQSNLITDQDVIKWLSSSIKMKKYVPVIRKYAVIGVIQNTYKTLLDENNKGDFDIAYLNMSYDIVRTIRLLLEYTDVEYSMSDITMSNYDLLCGTNFYSYVMLYAKEDYDNFVDKCDRATGIRDLQILHEVVNEIADKFNIDNLSKVREEINKMDMRKLGLLESVAKLNDPTVAQIADVMKKQAAVESMSKARDESSDESKEEVEGESDEQFNET